MCIVDISLWFPWVPWFPLKLRRDGDHRRLCVIFSWLQPLPHYFHLLCPVSLCINPNSIKAHVPMSCWPQSCAIACGHKAEHFEELIPKRINIKTTQLRLKNMDSQLHSSGFEEFLLCNYFSHRCQCHNKSMNSNKSQHKNTNSFRALKIQVCSKPVLVFKVLPLPE